MAPPPAQYPNKRLKQTFPTINEQHLIRHYILAGMPYPNAVKSLMFYTQKLVAVHKRLDKKLEDPLEERVY